MSVQKSKNSPTKSRASSFEIKKNKSNDNKFDTQSHKKMKPKLRSKEIKKITKSFKRIESEISQIQNQMAKIRKDLASVFDLVGTKKINTKRIVQVILNKWNSKLISYLLG